MDNSFNLARHIARLVWLLIKRSESVSDQKLELRAVVVMAREANARLSTTEGQLSCNGLIVPQVLSGVRELADRIDVHRVESVEIDQGVVPAELLAFLRLLAAPIEEGGAPVFAARVAELAPKTIHMRVVAPEPARVSKPVTAAMLAEAVAAAVVPLTGAAKVKDLFARLGAAGEGEVGRVLDEVAVLAEGATREGRAGEAADVFLGLMECERAVEGPEARRLFLLTTRRLTRPAVLRAIARLAVDDESRSADVERILVRCGDDGVDAAVDQFAGARTGAARRLYREMIARMEAADSALAKMLTDPRAHVARFAAELLGARATEDGERPLAEQLRHKDERMRRTVVRALGRIDTQFAIDALSRALGDESAAVRLEAVAALGARKGSRAGAVLARAIDEEQEPDVQLSIVGAMGRVATAETLSKLAKALEGGAGSFKQKKTPGLRLAAVHALAGARTPAALAALAGLVQDRERDVREAASRAVAR